jgi:hypothetical protein
MAAPDNAKLQANFKWEKDGSMINVYAANQAEFETLLTAIQDTAPLFISVQETLKGLSRINGVAVTPPVPQAAPAVPAPVAPAANGPACIHGPMLYKEGVGSKGPWKGYQCPAKLPIAQKCKTIWA